MNKDKMDADLGRSLGRIEGKVDMLLVLVRDADQKVITLEGRVRHNESWRHRVMGMATVVSTATTLAVTFLLRFLG